MHKDLYSLQIKKGSTLRRTLTPQQDKFLERELSLVKNLKEYLEDMKASKEDIDLIQV